MWPCAKTCPATRGSPRLPGVVTEAVGPHDAAIDVALRHDDDDDDDDDDDAVEPRNWSERSDSLNPVATVCMIQ